MFRGSTVVGIIEEAREQNFTEENFVSIMETVRKYVGKGNFDTLCKKIYAKYVYRGQAGEDEYFNTNYNEMIDNANSKEELEELENILISLYYEGDITPEEYTELMDKIEEKKNGIL